MTPTGYRLAVADELAKLAETHCRPGKNRRNWHQKASDLRSCGQVVKIQVCNGCGTRDGRTAAIECSCGLRVCPNCARHRAGKHQEKLDRYWKGCEKPRGMGLYLLTFTLRFDPTSQDDVSIEGLKRRRESVMRGVRAAWRKYLKPRAQAMAVACEVAPGGMVHAHALFHGWRPDAEMLRSVYMLAVGDSPQLNIRYVKKADSAIREVAKYLVKAASPRGKKSRRGAKAAFTSPALAARVEAAFANARLLTCYGALRGLETEETPQAEPVACAHCGLVGEFHEERMARKAWDAVAPVNWKPRFVATGPPSRPFDTDFVRQGQRGLRTQF